MTTDRDTAIRLGETSIEVAQITYVDLLRQVAEEHPDREAFVFLDGASRQAWTYAELLAEGEKAGRAMAESFAPGDRVAIWSANRPEWVFFQIGAALAGLVIVPLNPAFKQRETEYALRQSRSVGLFYTDSYRDVDAVGVVEAVRPHLPDLKLAVSFSDWARFVAAAPAGQPLRNVNPADPAMILYTSGTTGKPKGAILSHRGIVNTTRFGEDRFALPQGSSWLNSVPMFHSSGCIFALICAFWNAGRHVMLPAFDPLAVLKAVQSERIDWMCGVPTMAIAVLDHPDFGQHDLGALKVFVSGGTSVPADLVRRIEAGLGCEYVMVFGQTEMSGVICQTVRGDTLDHRTSTVGKPYPQTDVRIADPNSGQTLKIGEVGEICLRSFAKLIEYFDMPEATAKTIDADGWLHTGDMGTMSGDGYLTITGRLKEMIIRGGENIYPREVEDFLVTHPSIADVAVFGIPDETWGEQIVAAVRPRDPNSPPSPDELRAFAKAGITRFKVPVYWWFVDDYPVTAAGKIQKFELRRMFLEQMHELA